MEQGMILDGENNNPTADRVLKAAETAAHRAAAALGAEEGSIPCEVALPFLEHIVGPEDVKKIPPALLPVLAQEIRTKIHESVKKTGGHLASNLGVVELSIALHRVYDFSKDRLIFDVGHQVYPHKMLTGRANQFHTLRQADGLAGFPNHLEDPVYDIYHTSHAGCAVSTALGLAVGDHALGKKNHSVAFVGDGAMTAGLSFEALNHAGHLKEDLLVVFNDNGCSISPNVGALSATCSTVRKTGIFKRVRDKSKEILEKLPYGRDAEKFAEKVFDAANHFTHSPGSIFLDFGFKYFGPVDGHDFEALHEWLEEMKNTSGPCLLHVITQKGRGMKWAEQDPVNWHGAKPYDVKNGTAVIKKPTKPNPPDYCKVITDTILDAARKDEKVVAVTAAMAEGTGLKTFRAEIPERFYDVAICEQHAIAFSASLAKSGLKPVICIYSSFLQRAVDQLFHEISLQDGIPITVCMDRAGLCGDDGATANGVFDIAYMRSFPHLVLMAPKDGVEAEAMVRYGIDLDKPVFIRTQKEAVPSEPLTAEFKPLELGKGEIIREGSGKVAILAYGGMVIRSLEAADLLKKSGLDCTVANARFAKPLDGELLEQLLSTHDHVVTVEDHQLQNGFGTAVLEEANIRGLDTRQLVRLGIPDRYVYHGKRNWQLEQVGLHAEGIAKSILKLK